MSDTEILKIEIPTVDGEPLKLEVKPGDVVYFVGANGSGKSTLVQHLAHKNQKKINKIAAYRQISFSEQIQAGLFECNHLKTNFDNQDHYFDRRYKDDYINRRPDVSLNLLKEKESFLAREGLAIHERPLSIINKILQLANIHIDIHISEQGEFKVKKECNNYYLAHASDGERSAVLLAADVLISHPGKILLIDEPERHLHRSISAPLINELIKQRPDCIFFIATHDINLPSYRKDACIVKLRGIEVPGSTYENTRFKISIIEESQEIDEELKKDILGSRDKILFSEGKENSIDKQLLEIIFPKLTIYPKGSYSEVEKFTRGLKATEGTHWTKGWGLIDSDARDSDELNRLEQEGVFHLPFYSMEGFLYHPTIIKAVAQKLKDTDMLDDTPNNIYIEFLDNLFSSLNETKIENLAKNITKKELETKILKLSKSKISTSILKQNRVPYCIELEKNLEQEANEIRKIKTNKDYEKLIANYPLKPTGVVAAVCDTLKFRDETLYLGNVRSILRYPSAETINLIDETFLKLIAAVNAE